MIENWYSYTLKMYGKKVFLLFFFFFSPWYPRIILYAMNMREMQVARLRQMMDWIKDFLSDMSIHILRLPRACFVTKWVQKKLHLNEIFYKITAYICSSANNVSPNACRHEIMCNLLSYSIAFHSFVLEIIKYPANFTNRRDTSNKILLKPVWSTFRIM